MDRRLGALIGVLTVSVLAFGTVVVPAEATATRTTVTAAAPQAPLDDPFYDYEGRKPLRKVELGTVLKRRTVNYSIQGLSLPIKAIQLLYRTKNAVGRP